jgi:hypothetical protein
LVNDQFKAAALAKIEEDEKERSEKFETIKERILQDDKEREEANRQVKL